MVRTRSSPVLLQDLNQKKAARFLAFDIHCPLIFLPAWFTNWSGFSEECQRCEYCAASTAAQSVSSRHTNFETLVLKAFELEVGARTLLGAAGLTSSNKKLLSTKGIATRSKKLLVDVEFFFGPLPLLPT